MAHERWMEYYKNYSRKDDDSSNNTLRINKIETGEIHLIIHDWETGEEVSVGFTNHIGGGRSPNTLKALEDLALAIEKDNGEYPIEESGEVTHKNFRNRISQSRKNQRKK